MKHRIDQSALAAAIQRIERLEEHVRNLPRLHVKDICLRYSISKSTLYRLRRLGKLPVPIRFNGPLWRLEDLERAEQRGRLPGQARTRRTADLAA